MISWRVLGLHNITIEGWKCIGHKTDLAELEHLRKLWINGDKVSEYLYVKIRKNSKL